jgi:tRNA(Ile)-lysidine synthetase-like protein
LTEIVKIHTQEQLIVAHFNHGLRGAESDADELFLRDYCHTHHFVFETTKQDIASTARMIKKWIEETARIERYAFLASIMKQYAAKYILTAHHLDDNIETLILNLIRGTKMHGLTGIPEQNQSTLRPLLGITKTEIIQQLTINSIPYTIDSTNADDTYLRNHVRLNIIPLFERINPEYRHNLGSFISYAKELVGFLDAQVLMFLKEQSLFLVEDFQTISYFLQREVIRYLYEQANAGTIGLSEWWIAEIIRFIWDKGNYTQKDLGKLHLEKKNGRVYFSSRI